MYIDTNIVIYAISQDSKYGSGCTSWLERINKQEISAEASVLLLTECLHVLKSLNKIAVKKARKSIDIRMSLNAIMSIPIKWLELTPLVVLRASEFNYPLATGDALHIASMELNGITEILSADKEIDKVPGIQRIDPSL